MIKVLIAKLEAEALNPNNSATIRGNCQRQAEGYKAAVRRNAAQLAEMAKEASLTPDKLYRGGTSEYWAEQARAYAKLATTVAAPTPTSYETRRRLRRATLDVGRKSRSAR